MMILSLRESDRWSRSFHAYVYAPVVKSGTHEGIHRLRLRYWVHVVSERHFELAPFSLTCRYEGG